MNQMIFPFFLIGIIWLARIASFAAAVYLAVLLIRGLRKYLKSEKSDRGAAVRKSLGETIREFRTRSQMTQEFVAQSLGVSRQAVSKWESGASEPSTSNLLALAKLFSVSADELLKKVK